MKITNYILSFTFLLVSLCAEAQQLRKETFDLLNLDYPGFSKSCMCSTTMGRSSPSFIGLLPPAYRYRASRYRYEEYQNIQGRTKMG